jgi:hypothetical protein
MKALVVHDSAYGNTRQVAEAIVASLGPLTSSLTAGGTEIISKPMAFCVQGSEGPLRGGELQKAAEWARELLKRVGR